jgi:hypothetical protein
MTGKKNKWFLGKYAIKAKEQTMGMPRLVKSSSPIDLQAQYSILYTWPIYLYHRKRGDSHIEAARKSYDDFMRVVIRVARLIPFPFVPLIGNIMMWLRKPYMRYYSTPYKQLISEFKGAKTPEGREALINKMLKEYTPAEMKNDLKVTRDLIKEYVTLSLEADKTRRQIEGSVAAKELEAMKAELLSSGKDIPQVEEQASVGDLLAPAAAPVQIEPQASINDLRLWSPERKKAARYVQGAIGSRSILEADALMQRARGVGKDYDVVNWDEVQGKDLSYHERVAKLDALLNVKTADHMKGGYDEKQYLEKMEEWLARQEQEDAIPAEGASAFKFENPVFKTLDMVAARNGLKAPAHRKYNKEQLKAGAKVEGEHTRSKMVAVIIAMHHLNEDPQYYTKLASIHKD